MKLELKHLAPYLPYGLKMARFDSQFKNGHEIYTLTGLAEDFRYREEDLAYDDDKELLTIKEITFWFGHSGLNSTAHDVKPLLRPLSDLLKGEDFLGIQNLIRVHIGKSKLQKMCADGYGLIDLPYFITDYLFENHFDFLDLIEKGLAIDINTIES